MEKKKIKEVIYDLCIGKDIYECEDILKKNFNDVSLFYEKANIGDDGIFLIMSAYNVDNVYVEFYYMDDDYIVTDVSFSN